MPDDQPSTDLGDAGPDKTTMQLEVAPHSGPRCLLIDFAMATEERGARTGYVSATKVSSQSAAVLPGVMTTRTPTISGSVKRGSTLTARTTGWGPSGVKFTYRWKVNGKSISGATKSKFKIPKSYKGKRLTVSVRGSVTGYTPVAKSSSSTAKVK